MGLIDPCLTDDRAGQRVDLFFPASRPSASLIDCARVNKRWQIAGLIVLLGSSVTVMGQNHTTGWDLAACGKKPNCVSSQSSSERHKTEPFALDGSGRAAIRKLHALVSGLPGATITETEGLYLHAEFKSRLFGFVDDVEFLADEAAGKVHVRSASRVGYYDFGVNRRRVEKIRRLYDEQ